MSKFTIMLKLEDAFKFILQLENHDVAIFTCMEPTTKHPGIELYRYLVSYRCNEEILPNFEMTT